MDKNKVIETILCICKGIGLSVETKVKTDKWKADVVVDYGKYKVAFNVAKSPRNIEESYLAMREERVCGCWLLIPSKNRFISLDKLPCFIINDNGNNIEVFLAGKREDNNAISLVDFIPSIISGKIKYADKVKIKYVDVCFYKNECWKCHQVSDVYFVYKCVTENGIEIEKEIDCFTPSIVSGIQQFIKEHPEMNLRMGEIKPRFSRTVHTAYPSFGCAYCDSLFGKFFLNDSLCELIYCTDSLPKVRIEIRDTITVDANWWYLVK